MDLGTKLVYRSLNLSLGLGVKDVRGVGNIYEFYSTRFELLRNWFIVNKHQLVNEPSLPILLLF